MRAREVRNGVGGGRKYRVGGSYGKCVKCCLFPFARGGQGRDASGSIAAEFSVGCEGRGLEPRRGVFDAPISGALRRYQRVTDRIGCPPLPGALVVADGS